MESTDQAKMIRFYSAGAREAKPMDILTIEDLKAAGFVALKYKGAKRPDGHFEVIQDEKRLVHLSIPVVRSSSVTETPDFDHPVIRHEFGYGWEAKWGAVRFPLRNEVELLRFMKRFNYSLPIDKL